MLRSRALAATAAALAVAFGAAALNSASPRPLRIEVSVPAALAPAPLDGRVILVLSRRGTPEPRLARMTTLDAQPMFGVDVDGLTPGRPAVIDAGTRGWPVESLRDLPPGEYFVQATLNVYTTVTRADGHTLKVHLDQWEGQDYRRSPGNLVTNVEKVRIDPARGGTVRIAFAKKLPPLDPPADTKYVKHLKFRSDILSRWWGTDIYLGAIVLLPDGWAEHPNARYPVIYNHGHFPRGFYGFREPAEGQAPAGPPQPGGQPSQDRPQAAQPAGPSFYEDWVSGRLGRVIIVQIQHPTPFYDDSYAVNSANNGPYGDALWQELVPRVERTFRGIPEGWARATYGGSTGGWESLAWQIFYPDRLNGVWSFCPDPVDFSSFQAIDIYRDDNAFYPNSEWKRTPVRPWNRGLDDQTFLSQYDANHYEEVLGTRGRSGEQMDIFMAVFGPVGPDGYPKLLYDKWTGVIDRSVAEYWREHYDLRHILERDWKALGPKLAGKIHVFMGDQDTYLLEEAAFKLQRFLEGTTDPHYGGSFEIGRRQPHCYAGEPAYPGQRPEQRYLPKMIERMLMTAPAGADLSWRY
ncbi:MAG TPA: alpha/beta hydrolase-fold protein [Vicinamibacterales bacterium]|nr:alpha/beta hydrolase-fold protein [Vicinamibacterales bacterium]HPW21777.1 alpha/beta hydrolase-fold protein [Vicinamibacterales bacterium]